MCSHSSTSPTHAALRLRCPRTKITSISWSRPGSRIPARASPYASPSLATLRRIRRVRADCVVPLNYIGGRRIATEMMRPYFIRFLDDMVKDSRAPYRISSVTVERGSPLVGISLREAAIREKYGMSVLAIGDGVQPWRVNPDANVRLEAGTVMIVLGSLDQVAPLQAVATAR